MLFWIAMGIVYAIIMGLVMGYISEEISQWPHNPEALLGVIWPLVGAALLIAYLPYKLGMYAPRAYKARKARLAEIARRMRECPQCGEPHEIGEECEEDALMKRAG